jgi:Uma2 family endonuclease
MFPDVDERLVMPETRFEIIDGEVVYVPPADEVQGTLHANLSAILKAYAAPDYSTAVDMLTRTSVKNDMAPDASVFPSERDTGTGGRRIEALAFEVVSTERLSHAGKKARALIRRGVRRVFAIDVERSSALEWSRPTDAWEILPKNGAITDAVLVRPMSIAALIDVTLADDAVAEALIAKKNPVIAGALAEADKRGEARGLVKGRALALFVVLSARGFTIKKKARARILAAGDAQLDSWLARAPTCTSVDDLLR